MSDNISGYFLQSMGWQKSGNKYQRGKDMIVFNGSKWIYNGKEITDSISQNNFLKIPSFNPKFPPQHESHS